MDKKKNYDDMEYEVVEDWDELAIYSERAYYYPVNVIIRNGSSECERVRRVDFHYIMNLKIENPGPIYTSEDGKFLFAEDPETEKQWLISYLGQESEVTIPDGVYGIYDSAFELKADVESVHFPESLAIIGDYAFHGAGLRKAEFPASLETIGEGAFENCFRLSTAAFKGECKKESGDSEFKPGSLSCVQDLYLKSVPEGIISAMTVPVSGYRSEATSYTFTVHYRNSTFIFPREMDPDKIESAETMVRETESGVKVSGFELAAYSDMEVMTAFEAYRKYNIADARKCLLSYEAYPFSIAGDTSNENLMCELLDLYTGKKILTFDMLVEAKKVCKTHNWLSTLTRVMDLIHKTDKPEISFQI